MLKYLFLKNNDLRKLDTDDFIAFFTAVAPMHFPPSCLEKKNTNNQPYIIHKLVEKHPSIHFL